MQIPNIIILLFNSLKPSIGNGKNLERKLSLSITVPSRLSGNLEQEENQIVDDVEMYQLKDEFFNDFDFIPAKEA